MPHVDSSGNGHYRYVCVGLSDRRMMPLRRPGSTVLIDITLRRIEDAESPLFLEKRRGDPK